MGVKIGYNEIKVRNFPRNVFFEKRKVKFKRIEKREKTKSSFVTILKRIRAINLLERLFKASDNGSRITKHPSSNLSNG